MYLVKCHRNFNVARMERYLALARDADVYAVIILTKADLTDAPEDYERDTAKLLPNLAVITLDARNSDTVEYLLPWCGKGQTVAGAVDSLAGGGGGGSLGACQVPWLAP